MAEDPELSFIMIKRRNGQYRLYACRGTNKGCDKLKAEKKPKKPCEDCVLALEHETLGEIYQRIQQGDG